MGLRYSDRLQLTKWCELTVRRYRRVIQHKLGEYIISTDEMDVMGYYCPTCDETQPFENYWCCICGSPSVMGEPDDDASEDFDKYFEADRVKVLEFIGVTEKFKNYLYRKIKF